MNFHDFHRVRRNFAYLTLVFEHDDKRLLIRHRLYAEAVRLVSRHGLEDVVYKLVRVAARAIEVKNIPPSIFCVGHSPYDRRVSAFLFADSGVDNRRYYGVFQIRDNVFVVQVNLDEFFRIQRSRERRHVDAHFLSHIVVCFADGFQREIFRQYLFSRPAGGPCRLSDVD